MTEKTFRVDMKQCWSLLRSYFNIDLSMGLKGEGGREEREKREGGKRETKDCQAERCRERILYSPVWLAEDFSKAIFT